MNIHIQVDKIILIKLWGGQNTKYAFMMFFENVEIYALFGRTKWTQNPRKEDQNRFQGPGCVL